jgi:serine protease
MKKIYTLIVFLFAASQMFSQDYMLQTLTVKFKQGSGYPEKIRSGEISDIGEFKQIIGEHTLKSFVNPAILKNIEQRKKNDNNLLSSKSNIGLERIFTIEYQKKIDAKFASEKLSKFEFVEYAEPRYIHKIFQDSLPNDSLRGDQYYLRTINAIEAWAHVDTAGKQVVVSVVDTGVDYYHEDLEGVLYINPGEDGLDDNGNDKRTNGIDDDGNGFIDDWRGWDFAANNTEEGYDNDPMPGNPHGTHVAGIIAAVKNNFIGIAGIGLNTKILPVKIGNDNPFSRGLVNSYDGLLYAAIAGADIINCSWGSGGYSQSEQDVVNQVIELGSLIVAAAGNDYSQIAFFPASYSGVISVAAIDGNEYKASFSNYYSAVDVSAPGVDVMSTIPVNEYVAWSGTSMASPVAAAVAGMIRLNHPEYNNIQIGEHLKATSENIDAKNPGYAGLIGTGRVDAYQAVTAEYPVSISVKSYEIIEEIPDNFIELGERVDIKIELFNALNPVKNVRIFALSSAFNRPTFINDELYAGDFGEFETKMVDGTISFYVTTENIINFNLPITLRIIDDDGRMFTTTISVFVNPSWRTMSLNNITLTYTSQGNLAYDDFPNNGRGEGFKYRDGSGLLFEGALMIGYSHELLANVARGSSGSAKNRDFEIVKPIVTSFQNSDQEITFTEYVSRTDSLVAPVRVLQSGYQFKGDGKDDIIYAVYDVINETEIYQDSVYVGLYLDWDIGPSGSNNRAIWNKEGNFAYNINVVDESLELAGIKMISEHAVNFWAIDNDGDTTDNPGVYDGFTKEEKWLMLTSGIGRDSTNITDVSMVIGAGPIRLRAGDTTRVAFALFSGYTLEELESTAEKIPISSKLIPGENFSSKPKKNDIHVIFPNPASNTVTIELGVSDIERGELTLWDINGRKIRDIYNYKSSQNSKLFPGFLRIDTDLRELSQGQYLLRFVTDKNESTEILNIVRH